MAKKYRVISEAVPVNGKTHAEVTEGLQKMNLPEEHIRRLLDKPTIIKKGLDADKAKTFATALHKAGLKVRIQAYDDSSDAPKVETSVIAASKPETAKANAVKAAEKKIATPTVQDSLARDPRQQREELYQSLLQAFKKPLQPPISASSHYAAMAKALLGPLLYALIVLITLITLFWYSGGGHASLWGDLQWAGSFDGVIWFCTYALPCLTLFTALVLLLIPFWPRKAQNLKLALDAKKHARFHHLINQMTAAMDGPSPSTILLTPGTTLSAKPATSFGSSYSDIQLELGLALVSRLTIAQLLAAIAHQLGYFAHSASRRAYVWINRCNEWMSQCHQASSEQHQRLQNWVENQDNPIRIKLGSWATQSVMVASRFFAQLVNLNTQMTQTALIQMIKDADRYEELILGSDHLRAYAELRHQLMCGESAALELNEAALYQREQLLNNLPDAIHEYSTLDEAPNYVPALNAMPTINATSAHSTAYLCWSEPPIDQARLSALAGTTSVARVEADAPAHWLLDGFEDLCLNVTLHHYAALHIDDVESLLTPNQALLQDRKILLAQHRIHHIHASSPNPINEDGSIDWVKSD